MAELGKNLVVKKGGTTIALSRSCTFSLSRDTVDVSNKDSSARKREYGTYEASISTEHLVDFSDTTGVFSLDDALIAGTKVTASWAKATEAAGDISYAGSFVVVAFELNADDNAEGTASISLESDGDITKSTAV